MKESLTREELIDGLKERQDKALEHIQRDLKKLGKTMLDSVLDNVYTENSACWDYLEDVAVITHEENLTETNKMFARIETIERDWKRDNVICALCGKPIPKYGEYYDLGHLGCVCRECMTGRRKYRTGHEEEK